MAARPVSGRPKRRVQAPKKKKKVTARPVKPILALAAFVVMAAVIAVLAGRDGGQREPYTPLEAADESAPDEMTPGELAGGVDDGSGTDEEEAEERGTGQHRASAPVSPAAVPPVRQAEQVQPSSPPAAGPHVPGPGPQDQVAVLPPPQLPPPGAPLWRRNAVPAPAPDGRPRIVVVVDDMGVDRKRSDRVAALPGPLTLAWLPYAHDLRVQTAAARAHGHELIVHMPMEPAGKADPGPDALLSRLPAETLRARLRKNLSAFDGFVGINNHMGSHFTADRAGMSVVLSELAGRGLLFLDSRTTAETKGPELAAHYRVPLVQRDVFLDHDMSLTAVRASLAKLEDLARRKGVAVAIGHPHDATTAALTEWLPTLTAKGFQLVPLSAVAQIHGPAS